MHSFVKFLLFLYIVLFDKVSRSRLKQNMYVVEIKKDCRLFHQFLYSKSNFDNLELHDIDHQQYDSSDFPTQIASKIF